MAEPIPPVDDLEDELRRARAAIKQLKHAPLGETGAAARARACSLIAAQQRLKAAAQQVTDPSAARHVNGGLSGPFENKELDAFTRAMMKWFAKQFREMAREVGKELAVRDARIAELEATALTGGGLWKMGKPYKPGALATFDGVLWIAQEPNSDVKPGTSSHWRLMHKTKGKW